MRIQVVQRLSNWERSLTQLLDEARNRKRRFSVPTMRGDWDCSLFCIEAIYRMTGTQIHCQALKDAKTLEFVLENRQNFDLYLEEVAASYNLKKIPVAKSSKGDLMIFEYNNAFKCRPMGIKVGSFTAMPGEHSLGYIRSNLADMAYKIP